MNSRESATSRAKPISWVTTTMVMPFWARSFMTARTSPTFSGSRALVGSSNSMICGSIANDSRDGHALLLPAGQLRGIVAAETAQSHARQQLLRLLGCLLLVTAL